MVGYLIFTREHTINQAALDKYSGLVPATVSGHDLTMLVRYGTFEMLEGTPVEGAVVLRFPSVELAKAYYHSEAYQQAAVHRHAGAEYRVFVIEGVN